MVHEFPIHHHTKQAHLLQRRQGPETEETLSGTGGGSENKGSYVQLARAAVKHSVALILGIEAPTYTHD